MLGRFIAREPVEGALEVGAYYLAINVRRGEQQYGKCICTEVRGAGQV